MLKLDDEEQGMLAGEAGKARQWAMQQLVEVGRFFDAADLVKVAQAHIMADTEALAKRASHFSNASPRSRLQSGVSVSQPSPIRAARIFPPTSAFARMKATSPWSGARSLHCARSA